MRDLFLPNPDAGFFGIIAHWLFMGFVFFIILGIPFLATWSLFLLFPAFILMLFLD